MSSSLEDLDRKRRLALIALLEMLTSARKDRQEMLDETTIIERVLEDVENMDKYVERFKALEVVVDGFIGDAEGLPPNTPNTDQLNRLRCIRNALNVYRNAYANYAVEFIAQINRKGD